MRSLDPFFFFLNAVLGPIFHPGLGLEMHFSSRVRVRNAQRVSRRQGCQVLNFSFFYREKIVDRRLLHYKWIERKRPWRKRVALVTLEECKMM